MTNNPNKPKRQSGLVLRPLNPQEVQLRPAPVWSKALAWTIIATASFGFVFAIFARIDEVVLAEENFNHSELNVLSKHHLAVLLKP